MAVFLFANNTATTLAGPIASGATSLSVAAGTGGLYPNPTTGQQFAITLRSQSSPGTQREIAYCTARSGDVFTIIRGQEGTTPLSFVAGDLVDNFLTAGTTAAFTQASQLQQQAGNYGVDTGSANALAVTLSTIPATLASITGSPIRVKVAHNNTGATTLTVNSLPTTVVTNPDGTSLAANQLVANGVAEMLYNGSSFMLTSRAGNHQGFSNFVVIGSSQNWTVPSGVYSAKFTVTGGGGGGSDCSSLLPASQTNDASGGGGGGGGTAIGIYAVTPGQVIPITIGAGGLPQAAGGNTIVGNLISATGGTGSLFQSTGTSAGGAPGVGVSNQFNLYGGWGSDGQSGVGSFAGNGGGSYWGGGIRAYNGNTPSGAPSVGAPGVGGGGAYNSATVATGLSGVAGVVVIEY